MKRLLLAVVLPVVLLALVEGGLRLARVAEPPRFFVRRSTERGTMLEANLDSPWGALPFEPASFPLQKPAGTWRVFCVGESTANGFPYARHSSFAKWLRVRLATLLPEQRVEIVKMGYDAKSTQELADLCSEVVRYEPDLVVLYAGHNQFLPQNLGPVRHPIQDRVRRWLQQLRLARCLMRILPGAAAPGEAADRSLERDAPSKSGPRSIDAAPYLSDAEKAAGYRLYREGLARIAADCASHGVVLLACVPVSNLRDYAPNKSHLSAGLAPAQRERVLSLCAETERLLLAGDAAGAAARGTDALAIDATPALLHYDLARALDRLGDLRAARAHYELARDQDDLPNRATSRNLAVLNEVLAPPVLLADCPSVFDAAASGIPGADLFVDNCHPELRAQKLIADAILQRLAAAGLPRPRSEWRFADEPSVEEYWKRMGLSLEKMTSDFARDAITNLLQLLGRIGDAPLAAATEDALRFGLRYDPANATAQLGLALAAALRGDAARARDLFARSRARDPAPAQHLLELARANARLARLLGQLSSE